MIFDTDFLIAYGKGSKALSKTKARAYVDALPTGEPLLISRVTWMEFAAGYETKAEAEAESSRFTVVEFDSELWFPTSRIIRDLSRRGQRIGAPDCMIAATAIAYGQPLVTLNRSHFSRVTGLRVESPQAA